MQVLLKGRLRDLRDGTDFDTRQRQIRWSCSRTHSVQGQHDHDFVQEWKESFSQTRTSGTIFGLSLSHHEEHLKSQKTKLKRDLTKALDSVGAYVERADTMMILAPSSVHTDLVDSKTGRKNTHAIERGEDEDSVFWNCLLCVFVSTKTHPVLLVRSELDAPIWISPQES